MSIFWQESLHLFHFARSIKTRFAGSFCGAQRHARTQKTRTEGRSSTQRTHTWTFHTAASPVCHKLIATQSIQPCSSQAALTATHRTSLSAIASLRQANKCAAAQPCWRCCAPQRSSPEHAGTRKPSATSRGSRSCSALHRTSPRRARATTRCSISCLRITVAIWGRPRISGDGVHR